MIETEVYGADFSGAREPKGIYYAKGRLSGATLTVDKVQRCDDRLDLFTAIVDSNAPWGLDFPFGVATQAYERLGLSDWPSLLALAGSLDRKEFRTYLY